MCFKNFEQTKFNEVIGEAWNYEVIKKRCVGIINVMLFIIACTKHGKRMQSSATKSECQGD